MVNPYYVDPSAGGAQLSQSLAGLGDVLQERREASDLETAKAEEGIKAQEAQGAMLEAFRSGDPNKVAEFSLQHPQLSELINEQVGLKDDRQKLEASTFIRETLTASPENVEGLYRTRIQTLQDQGRDPSDTIQSYQDYLANPEAEIKDLEIILAGANPDEYKAYSAQRSEDPTYAMGSGDMAGYAFNPQTGEFSISADIKAGLQQKAADKAAEGLELDFKSRKEINSDISKITKDVKGIHAAAQSLDKLKDSASPAAQIAATFKFMKAMDPTSTVRESELGMIYSAEGAAKGMANKINQLLGEGGLSQEGFQDIVNTAQILSNSAITAGQDEAQTYLDTYEDTLPQTFKELQMKRIPSIFEVETAPAQGLEQMSDEELSAALAAAGG